MSDTQGPRDVARLRGMQLDADGALKAVAARDAWLLDVREDDEWAAGHAPDAHHVPLGEVADRLGEMPSDQAIAVICRSGGRSAAATKTLLDAGKPAVNVSGGMQGWAEAGGAVVTDDGTDGHVL